MIPFQFWTMKINRGLRTMENKEKQWIKAANLCINQKDYVKAIVYYEKLGYMENVAALYLKIGDWPKASDIYFQLGFTEKACEIEQDGRRGKYNYGD